MQPMKFDNYLVDEYTSPCTIQAAESETVIEIMKKMVDNEIRHIPVVKDGQPLGLVTERDLKLVINSEWGRSLKATDVMVTEPFVVKTGELLRDVVFEMSKRKIGSALVVDSTSAEVGIFTSTDALNALIEVLTD